MAGRDNTVESVDRIPANDAKPFATAELDSEGLAEALDSDRGDVRRHAARRLIGNISDFDEESGLASKLLVAAKEDRDIRLGVYEGLDQLRYGNRSHGAKGFIDKMKESILADAESLDGELTVNAFALLRDELAADPQNAKPLVSSAAQILRNDDATPVRRLESAALLRDSGRVDAVLQFIDESLPQSALEVFLPAGSPEEPANAALSRQILSEFRLVLDTRPELVEALQTIKEEESGSISDLAEGVLLYWRYEHLPTDVERVAIDELFQRVGGSSFGDQLLDRMEEVMK